MAHAMTQKTVRNLLAKGLTGSEAGRIVVQNYIDESCGKPGFLNEQDATAIFNGVNGHENGVAYNKYMALQRALNMGFVICDLAAKEACLNLALIIGLLRDANTKKTVDLFSYLCPHIVSRKQYEEIVTAQKERKLTFEYSLGYVIEKRFYAIAPQEAKEKIDEADVDIESAEAFLSAVPEKYSSFCKKAVSEIHALHTTGKLKAIYHDEDAKEVEPLLNKWDSEGFVSKEAMKLVDMLFVTGQQLYECDELPEWKRFIDKYQTHWFSDEDERFKHDYAILEDSSSYHLDEKGYYKTSFHPSEWITRIDELTLGLRASEDEEARPIEIVNAMLLALLDKVELDARLCQALKVVIDASLKAAGIEWEEGTGSQERSYHTLKIYAEEYNRRLEELQKEEQKSWNTEKTKLETVLSNLPSFDLNKLIPSSPSLERLKEDIFERITSDNWLRMEVASLEYEDSFSFKKTFEND